MDVLVLHSAYNFDSKFLIKNANFLKDITSLKTVIIIFIYFVLFKGVTSGYTNKMFLTFYLLLLKFRAFIYLLCEKLINRVVEDF